MVVLCVALFLPVSLLLVMSMIRRADYLDYLNQLNRSDYNLLDFMPMGLLAAELLAKFTPYKPGQTRDAALRHKVVSMYGERHAKFYLLMMDAYRLTSALVMVWLFSLIGCAAGMGELGLLGIGLGALMYATGKNKPDALIKQRRSKIQMEFPDFMSKFVLLLGANMTVSKAWQVATEGAGNTALGNELMLTAQDIRTGMTEAEALNGFARRVRNADVSRFVSAVVQNLEQGGENLADVLDAQLSENWMNRKQTALRLGQEATSKLVFPMVMMFLAIMVLVLAPALMTMAGGF